MSLPVWPPIGTRTVRAPRWVGEGQIMASTTSKKAQTEADRQASIETLRALLPPGSVVSTALVHVSRSGMYRVFRPIITADGEPCDISWHVLRAGIGSKPRSGGAGVGMSGCGMDMGFALVYELSRTLYPDGFPCTGETERDKRYPRWDKRCPSNDHSNGDRDFTPGKQHTGGGYALRHRHI